MRTSFHEFFVRAERSPSPPSAEQRKLAASLVFELRFGLESREPGLVEALLRLIEASPLSGPSRERLVGLSSTEQSLAADLLQWVEDELERGRLVIEPLARSSLTDQLDTSFPELQPLPPARSEPDDHSFELRVLDEVGQSISGVEVEFSADGLHPVSTNAAGVALLSGLRTSSASASLLDSQSLTQALEPRWQRFRPGKPPKEANVHEVVFRGGELGPFPLKAEVPNTVILKPPLGQLFVELFDKTGRVRHAERSYSISGPMNFAGTTDDQGRLRHEPAFPGDYTLTLRLDEHEAETGLVTLDASATVPQVRFIGAVRRCVLGRLRKMFFETNKSFLLPGSVAAFRRIRTLYSENTPSELLIVGHTDTTAEPTVNDPLSLERAAMTAAYLEDDVDTWLKAYESNLPVKRRWGAHEDELMLSMMPDFGSKPEQEDPVRWFQRTRGLEVDGDAGPQTRAQLITEYMALDGTSLKDRRNFDIRIATHGCGENFPLEDDGEELDAIASNDKEDASDRRVELFFFDSEFGIQPPPPGPNSTQGSSQYPEWRKQVTRIVELESGFLEGMIVEWSTDLDAFVPKDLVLEAKQGEKAQRLAWTDGFVDGPFRRFVFRKILGGAPVTLTAASEELGSELVLWKDQVINDPDVPPTWENWLEDLLFAVETEPDGDVALEAAVPASSDLAVRPPFEGQLFA